MIYRIGSGDTSLTILLLQATVIGIFNSSVKSAIIPEVWKLANVSPIIKETIML